jgi:hypothetical protein
MVLKSKSKRRRSVFVHSCPFDGFPCDCPVPRGFTACPECSRNRERMSVSEGAK